MTKDEALKMALEALELSHPRFGIGTAIHIKAVAVIKEALAQPEPWEKFCDSNCVWTDHHPDCKLAQQEPVVWMYQDKSTHEVRFQKHMRGFVDHGATYETPLYATPPQRKPLSDEEILTYRYMIDWTAEWSYIKFARAIEAALRTKNT